MTVKWNVIKRDHKGNQLDELSTQGLFVNKKARIGYKLRNGNMYTDSPVSEVKSFDLGLYIVKTPQYHYTIKQVEE